MRTNEIGGIVATVAIPADSDYVKRAQRRQLLPTATARASPVKAGLLRGIVTFGTMRLGLMVVNGGW